MASYTLVTTALQDAAISLLAMDYNAQAAVLETPPLTPQEYFLDRLGRLLADWSAQMGPRILARAAEIYPTLSEEQRVTLLTALGRASFVVLPLADQVVALRALALADFAARSQSEQTLILQTLGLAPPSAAP